MVLGVASVRVAAQPTGGQVVAGAATLSSGPGGLTVTQTSGRAIINWQDFSIAAGDFARFVQPDAASATLNRVVSGLPSSVLGSLEANGRVFLINPNGILIGAGARIDTGGFLASTLDVANRDFLAGGDLKFSGDSTAAVQNLGAINALGGDVFLIARRVENTGTISAAGGTVGLAAGSEVLLTTGGSERVFVQAGSAPGTLANAGPVNATTAELKAAGGNAYALAINNSGTVRATGSEVRNGQVWLVATGESTVQTSGTLDASSATGQGGKVTVTGGRVVLADGARVDASGATGGGEILVFGDASGGGQVTVGGTLDARATGTGDGGFIETSAARVRVTDAARVTTTAANGRNGTWLIDPVDFKIAATGGDMTGTAVGTALAGGNFTIQSTTGASGTLGDVNVNDSVSWTANKLTLNAHNNINFNAALNGSGTASLALQYGQGAVAASNLSTYVVKAAINLPAGNNFSTKLGSDGAVNDFTVITSLGAQGSATTTDLQGMSGNLAGRYVLGANIDATATSTWNAGAGFTPVSTGFSKFTGTFDGLGHTIGNLTINSPTVGGYVGLFGFAEGAAIRNVGLVGGSVTGAEGSYVGGLLGYNFTGSTVSNSYNTGSVTRGGTTTSGRAGGLVGTNFGAIRDSYATGSVSGIRDVGGLTGGNDTGGTITNSYATGNVSGTGVQIGGLVGILNGGTVSKSYATGTVTGIDYVGGLVGIFWAGTVSDGYATGNVSGRAGIGGLVGNSQVTATTVFHSYATGSVTGTGNTVGGLMGNNGGTVSESYATGNVSTTGLYAGGLLGASNGTVANSYATGSVSGTTHVGGLTGYNNGTGTSTNTYAVGSVTGTSFVGGLLGRRDNTATVSNSFWNSTVSATGIGSDGNIGDTAGATGRTTAQMMTLANFSGAGWGIASTGGAGAVWRIYEGSTTPWLTYFLKPYTVTVNNDSKTYNGLAYSGGNGVVHSITSPSPALSGTLSYTGTAQSAVNAGSYVLGATGLYSVQQGYDISYVAGALTVNKANLTLSGTQVYNGLTAFAGANLTATGVNGETFTMTGAGATGNLATKNVQTSQLLASVAGLTIGTGNTGAALASNYNLAIAGSSVNVTRADLTLTGTRVYDGLTVFAGSNLMATGVAGETFAVTGAGAAGNLASKDVQTGTALATTTGLALGTSSNGGLANNYNPFFQASSSVSVTKANLTLSGTRVYNGATTFAATDLGSVATGVNGETFALSGAGDATNLSSKNVQTGALASVTGLTLGVSGNGGLLSNYNLLAAANSTISVTKANLTLTGTRVYNGATTFAASDLSSVATGVNGETFALTGSGTLSTKNVQTSQPLASVAGLTLGAGNTGAAVSTNYNTLAPANSTVTVTKAPISITSADVVKTYDGTLTAAGSPVILVGQLFGSDVLTFSGLGPTYQFVGTGVGTGKTVTVTGINVNDGNNGQNYTRTLVNNTTSTINPFAVSLSASRVYNGSTSIAANLFTFGALVGTETLTLTGTGAVTSKDVGTGKAVTGLTLADGTGLASNYTFTGGTQTASITKADLTLTGTQVYNGLTAFAGANLTATGVNGETFTMTGAGATGNLTTKNVQTNQLLASAAGLTIGTGNTGAAVATNYTLTAVNSSVSVTPLALTITGFASNDKIYDGLTAAVVATPGTLAGVVSGDNVSFTHTGATFATPNVGTGLTTTLNGVTLTGGDRTNYTHTAVTTDLSAITAATLTYTATPATRLYGASNPAFTGTVTGFVNGETLLGATTGTAAFTTTATSANNVGTYALPGSGLTANNGNYVFVQAAGNATAFSITPAPLTITADNKTKIYGAALPAFTATYTGLVNGDSLSVVTGLTLTGTATAASNVGTTALTAANGTAANYTITHVPGTLTITPAPLTITADNNSRAFGATDPVFTATYTGLVNNDTTAAVSGLSLATTALTASPVGSYAITASGATAANYTITHVPGLLAIGQNLLTITADNKTKTYGAALPTFTASYAGLLNGDTSSVVTGLQFSTTALVGSNVGTYTITPFGATAASYTLAYVAGQLTINPAALTLTANNATRLYGAANPAFTASYAGLVNGDTAAVVTGLTFATPATALSNVGSYAITPLNGAAANYTITHTPGALSVTPAPLTVTADNKSKLYGAALPTFTATYTGLLNGDTSAVVTGLTLTTPATAASNVGTSAITAANGAATNYTITHAPGALTITPAPLTITAESKSRSVGVANPLLTASYFGLVNNDTTAVVSGLSLATTALLNSPVGSYPITASGATAGNYAITFVNGLLAVGQNLLTITADNKSKTYGAALPAFTASYAGLLNGDTSSVVTGLQFSTTALIGSNVGTYAITPFGATAPGYALAYVAGQLTINPAALTVTATNATRLYGAANPAFTASYAGLVNGDTSAVVTGLTFGTPATVLSNVGAYALTPANGTATNYTIAHVPGALSVTPAPLTIAADNKSRAFGVANPAFTATYTGLVNGDTSAVVTGLALATTAVTTSPGGNYPITAAGATAANYALTFVPGTLTIGQQGLNLLTITADNLAKIYGAALPAFTASYAGLVNGDTPSVVTGLQFATTASAGSNVGTYTITPFGGTAASYTLAYVSGLLTINPANLLIAADNQSRAFGVANPPLTARFTGLVNGDTSAVVSGLSLATTAVTTSPGGNYPITAAGATAANYAITFAPGTLVVGQQALNLLTITADNKTKTYGAPLPTFTATFAGLLNGDTPSVVTGLQFNTTASASSNVGTYTITPFGGTAPSYTLAYVPGTLTINPAALTITANNAARTYGAGNPAFGASFAGFVNGDTSALVTGLQLTTPATTATGVGSYAITPGGASAPNYALTFVPGTLTINRASLTLTAANAARDFGAPNPAFTGTFAGFVNGDTAAVVSGLTFSTPATATSAAGDYAITPFATAANYSFAFVNGTLRVIAPTVTVGTAPVPVVTVNNQPALTPELAVVNVDGRLVLVPVNPPGGVTFSLDGQLAVTLGEVTGLPGFQSSSGTSRTSVVGGPRGLDGPNLGNFELAPAPAGGGGPGSGQANEPGLYRESTVNMGGFNVVYHEAVADARQQSESNTALGSSYREFSDDDNPQVNHVRSKVDRKPADSSSGRGAGGAQ